MASMRPAGTARVSAAAAALAVRPLLVRLPPAGGALGASLHKQTGISQEKHCQLRYTLAAPALACVAPGRKQSDSRSASACTAGPQHGASCSLCTPRASAAIPASCCAYTSTRVLLGCRNTATTVVTQPQLWLCYGSPATQHRRPATHRAGRGHPGRRPPAQPGPAAGARWCRCPGCGPPQSPAGKESKSALSTRCRRQQCKRGACWRRRPVCASKAL